jgi:acyl-CoA dehydrogenase
MTQNTLVTELLDKANRVSSFLGQQAHAVDAAGVFPHENLQLLRDEGFMKLFIPVEFGGHGYGLQSFFEVTRILAKGCISTAVIWSMHFQQVLVLINHLEPEVKGRLLGRISAGNLYVGSVTTETGKGGTLLKCNAALAYENSHVILDREAPVVTGGDQCDAYLITMRKEASATENEVVLIFAEKNELEVKLTNKPQMLGMKGTYTTGIHLYGKLPPESIVNPTSRFSDLCISTMIPVGHLAWAFCWLGATQSAYQFVRDKIFRNPANRQTSSANEADHQLVRVRMKIDLIEVYIRKIADLYFLNKDNIPYLSSGEFQLKINNLKVASSEMLYECVNGLIELAGLHFGYINSPDTPLERILRDLRSAALMFHNKRLLDINGKLLMFEKL